MQKSTFAFFFGIGMAGLIILAGYVADRQAEGRLAAVISRCKNQNLDGSKKNRDDGPWKRFVLICEPSEIARFDTIENPTVGVQQEVMSARSDLDRWSGPSYAAAALVTLFFAVPYGWYFFLRRLREVRLALSK